MHSPYAEEPQTVALLLPPLPLTLQANGSPPDLATLCAEQIARDAASSLQGLLRGHGWRLLTPVIRTKLLSALGTHGALSDGLLEQLLHAGVQDLNLSECAQVTNHGMALVSERCVGLHRLQLKGLSVSDDALRPLATRCTRLAALHLSRCRRISDGLISLMAKHLALTEVDLSHCRQLGDEAAESLLRCCPQILKMRLDGTRVTDALLGELAEGQCDSGASERVSQKLPGLQCLIALSLQGCRLMSEHAIRRVCNHARALQLLRLGGTAANDYTIEVIAEISGLRALSLEGCSAISGRTLPLLLLGCSALASLDVSRCALVSTLQFHHSSHSIRELQLSNCAALSVAALRAVTENCEALRALWLDGCAVLDDSLVFELCQGCSALERVSFSHCDNITERAVFYVAMQLRHVVELCLGGCAQLQDDQVLAAAQMCSALRVIELPSRRTVVWFGGSTLSNAVVR
jgi:hypothetical protein